MSIPHRQCKTTAFISFFFHHTPHPLQNQLFSLKKYVDLFLSESLYPACLRDLRTFFFILKISCRGRRTFYAILICFRSIKPLFKLFHRPAPLDFSCLEVDVLLYNLSWIIHSARALFPWGIRLRMQSILTTILHC